MAEPRHKTRRQFSRQFKAETIALIRNSGKSVPQVCRDLDLAESSLTVSEVADIIADVIGRPVSHNDIDRDAWIGGAIAAGFVPADYAVMLRWLTGTIISGNGSRPKMTLRRSRAGRQSPSRTSPGTIYTKSAAKVAEHGLF